MTAPYALRTHVLMVGISTLKPGDVLANSVRPDSVIESIDIRKRADTRPEREGTTWIDYHVTFRDGTTNIFHCVAPGSQTTVRRLGHHPSNYRAGCRCHDCMDESRRTTIYEDDDHGPPMSLTSGTTWD